MYSIGWGLCICCPFGCAAIAWYWVACKHYCRSREQRSHMQQERVVAQLSLGTAILSTVVGIVVLIILLTTEDLAGIWPQDAPTDPSCESPCRYELELYDRRSTCDSWDGVCYGSRRRRW
mmetsp:Transcript_15979/g.43953  ORF Transcript_15979/g.43953 Transcript_15979/m.43953 type:complete len:120 (-) Transcript_15979:97-456(-)